MAKADLHVHSKYSDYPSTWILKAYQSPESFTEPELLYQQAKSRGMDLVTITDHDDIRGCLELRKAHPEDTFISCEITTWFPEDGCKIHILVYGIEEEQYKVMMEIRSNIYQLRDYIYEQKIAHSVAHATYDQDGKLSFDHIEKLVLLFDVFEVINGGSSTQNNVLLHHYIQSLDEQAIDKLQAKHNIKPKSTEPWIKGFTGGSDDHCGILIGTAYTHSLSQSTEQFLSSLRNKASLADGLHGTFEIYATGVFKHIHDYRNDRDEKYPSTKMNMFLEMFFEGDQGNWIKRFKKSHSLRYLKRKNTRTHKALHQLLAEVNDNRELDIAHKIPLAYTQVANLHDEMFRSIAKALVKNLPEGNIFKAFQKMSTIFPMLTLAAPFIGSMRHQVLKSEIKNRLIEATNKDYTHKTLWFTDTIDDLNGVSVSLRQIANQSRKLGYQLRLFTSVEEDKISTPLPEGTLNQKPIYSEKVPGYEQQTITFPSLLTMMKTISDEQPDQIVISTPGPVGLGALVCAKLMDIPAKTIYHTDFGEQIFRMTNESFISNFVDQVVNAFYSQADHVYVPSMSYINKLADAGIDRSKMSIFPRGIDTNLYKPATDKESANHLISNNKLNGEFTLLFAGRISEDKNLSLLVRIFELANQSAPERYNLVVAGDGPYLKTLKQKTSNLTNVHYTGRIDSDELVSWYQASDLLVFPSHTDTFGMVVLEAQACGTPCLVTASGGPKEIIENQKTGLVVSTDEEQDWYQAIDYYYQQSLNHSDQYQQMLEYCTQRVLANNSWDSIFETVLGEECRLPQIESNTQDQLEHSVINPEQNNPTDKQNIAA